MRNGESIRDYYRRIEKQLRETIRKNDDGYILGVDVEEYTEYLFNNLAFSEIVFDDSRKFRIAKKREARRVRGRFPGEHHTQEQILAEVYVPILQNPKIEELLGLSASTFTLSPLEIGYSKGYLMIRSEPDELAIQRHLKELRKEIEWKNDDIRNENERIKKLIRKEIEDRKGKIRSEENLFDRIVEKLPLPISRKSEPDIVLPDFSVKKEIRPVLKPAAQRVRELALERDVVDSILSLMDNTCLQFERTPETFSDMDESDLRNVILSNLNGVFQGKASAEAFSKGGRTDILLRVDKGGIFITECKIWNGEKAMIRAIGQVLGYLTWRESYGVIISFSRNKDFTSVLEQAYHAIKTHTSFRKGRRKLSDSHFVSHNRLPTDQQKVIEIHYMLYDLYSG